MRGTVMLCEILEWIAQAIDRINFSVAGVSGSIMIVILPEYVSVCR